MERKLCSCNRTYEQSLSGMCELCWNEAYPSKLSESDKDLSYWEKNAEENYMTTPISVLRYITELENALEDKEEKEESIQILKDAKEQAKEQKTLEEAADSYENSFGLGASGTESVDFIEGAKWQAGRLYSEEEVIKLLIYCKDRFGGSGLEDYTSDSEVKQWFEQFKKK
jgi:hypothetical protein